LPCGARNRSIAVRSTTGAPSSRLAIATTATLPASTWLRLESAAPAGGRLPGPPGGWRAGGVVRRWRSVYRTPDLDAAGHNGVVRTAAPVAAASGDDGQAGPGPTHEPSRTSRSYGPLRPLTHRVPPPMRSSCCVAPHSLTRPSHMTSYHDILNPGDSRDPFVGGRGVAGKRPVRERDAATRCARSMTEPDATSGGGGSRSADVQAEHRDQEDRHREDRHREDRQWLGDARNRRGDKPRAGFGPAQVVRISSPSRSG
jgi:hypothetical protein